MLQVKHLSITHKKDLRTIIQDFSCVFNYGDKVVIIGEEGNGKSTLLKWIYDPESIELYATGKGERIANRERVGYLPQELSPEDKQRTVYDFFVQEPSFLEQSEKELKKLAHDFHVPNDFFYEEQEMKTLSGGEKIKIQMMRLLMANPTVLLLDEPSNDIDIETLEWLERMIIDWPYIVIYISHDEALIEKTANVVIHLEQLRHKTQSRYTVANMSYARYIEERRNKFTKQELIALNERREQKIREEKLHRIEQSVAYKLDNISKAERDAKGRLLKKKMKAVKSMAKRFEREDENMTQMPEEESVIFFKLGDESAEIPQRKIVLDYFEKELFTPDEKRTLAKDIHLLVRGSEKICIVGRNGVGKTTLLQKVAEILLQKEDIRAEYMPQNYEELLKLEMTPVDFLSIAGDKEESTRIRTFLGALKYTADEMNHPIAELSGGQKAKVLLLKMSMSKANVLILDEPTRNFSPISGPVIRKMLSEFPGAIISISHDRKYIDEVCTGVYELTEGGLVEWKKSN